ncbi:homocysteine S-methyltransferase family protein [Pelagibius sp. Alg239-R121]|uniref:homocysteine S-methyltransferase family protein n=1 Tax=Pelagibius sp. Alg239-R121 TaxID=2993448 RepID=UPI0024A6BACE|nr:homocysteine S-methyltransferase family protein [Pelagibius sp. Alg239-R121]
MSRYDQIMQRLSNGGRVLIDGATGTEVERRGVPQLDNAWNGGGALSHPGIVKDIHKDYIRLGAEIVISNTFATHRHALQDGGVEEHFELLNRRGVELAVEAREEMQREEVLVAGGISYWSWIGKHPPLDQLRGDITEQAAIMRKAGADLLMTEMMIDIDRMLVTLEAARSSGLPVWVGLTCEPGESGTMCLRNGEPLIDALAALKANDVPLVSIMHSEVKHIDACLDVMADHWPGPIGVYAHTGKSVNHKWVFDDTILPEDYAAHSRRWLERGVQVIGGCCGIRTDHMAELQKVV